MSSKVTISVLTILLVCTSLLAVYGFISKGKSVPAVALVIKGSDDFGYTSVDKYSDVKFWDNYPYWVILSERKKLDTSMAVAIQDTVFSLYQLTSNNRHLFLRVNPLEMEHTILDSIMIILHRSGASVTILTDESSKRMLLNNYFRLIQPGDIGVLDTGLPLPVDKSNLPYFFTLSGSFVVDNIYIPRKETPEVLNKYLEEIDNLK